jgi:hypothetical protein
MKKRISIAYILLLLLCLYSCNSQKNYDYAITKNYKPDDPELYKTIVNLDSIFFSLYNSCDRNLKKYGDFYSEDIEFYHDKGGLMTSKKDIIEGTQKNVCGKVTRELVKGSIEVYPIKDYGALEIGLQKFHNNTEPENTESKTGRFMIFWKKENNIWKIARVVSLH